MFDRLLDLVGDDTTVYAECRRCGTEVEGTTSACPDCGGEIAFYRLE